MQAARPQEQPRLQACSGSLPSLDLGKAPAGRPDRPERCALGADPGAGAARGVVRRHRRVCWERAHEPRGPDPADGLRGPQRHRHHLRHGEPISASSTG
ncbi:hypothetical protein G5V59_05415 [Nocardioides sp. W3-2-3]|nr:hypothetical protein [Nocardioides convexus]